MKYSYRVKDNLDLTSFKELMIKHHHIYDDVNPEYVFVFGGDGTVLNAVHDFENTINDVTLVGINFGNLGFYTDFKKDEILKIIEKIENNDFEVCKLPLIEYSFKNKTKTIKGLALNEVTMISSEKTMVMDIYINNNLFEKFRGTGVCIASPSGSTAYNKSLGGAVVDISLPSMQLTEIASINNRIFKTIGSPLILSKTNTLMMKPITKDGVVFTKDNHKINIDNVEEVNVYVSNKHLKLLTNKNHLFFNRVKNAFIGEIDD